MSLTGTGWQPTVKSRCPYPKLKALSSVIGDQSKLRRLISPYFLLIPKSLGAWRWLGGVNSPVEHCWLSCSFGNREMLSLGLFVDLSLARHDGGCKVERLLPHSSLLEIISRKTCLLGTAPHRLETRLHRQLQDVLEMLYPAPAREAWRISSDKRALASLQEGVCLGAERMVTGLAESFACNCSLKERPEITLEKRRWQ